MKKRIFLGTLCLIAVALLSCTNKIDKALLEYQTAIEEQDEQHAIECHDFIQSMERSQLTNEQYSRFETLSHLSDSTFLSLKIETQFDSLRFAMECEDYQEMASQLRKLNLFVDDMSADQLQQVYELGKTCIEMSIVDDINQLTEYIKKKDKKRANDIRKDIQGKIEFIETPTDSIREQYEAVEKLYKETFITPQQTNKIPAEYSWIQGTWIIQSAFVKSLAIAISGNRVQRYGVLINGETIADEGRFKVVGETLQPIGYGYVYRLDTQNQKVGIVVNGKTYWGWKYNSGSYSSSSSSNSYNRGPIGRSVIDR